MNDWNTFIESGLMDDAIKTIDKGKKVECIMKLVVLKNLKPSNLKKDQCQNL